MILLTILVFSACCGICLSAHYYREYTHYNFDSDHYNLILSLFGTFLCFTGISILTIHLLGGYA